MKRISFIALAIILISQSSCLKDSGFENQQYGIKDPSSASAAGVGFNLLNKTNYKKTVGLLISDQPQQIDGDAVMLALYSGSKAEQDIHIKVAVDPTILADYNAEQADADPNWTDIPEFDPTKYTIITDVVIPAGQQYAPVKITIPSTVGISADNSYAIGLKIISADAGYTIASNMNKTLVEIVIKNQYDGDYVSNGYFYHPASPRGITDRPKTLATVNATSVWTELGDLGGNGYFAIFDVDPTSNAITIRQYPGSVSVVEFGTGLPTTNPGYTAQWANSAECNNVYDPATESFKVRYGYVGGTGYRVTEEIIVKE